MLALIIELCHCLHLYMMGEDWIDFHSFIHHLFIVGIEKVSSILFVVLLLWKERTSKGGVIKVLEFDGIGASNTTSLPTLIFLDCIFKICALASSLGCGNPILRSNCPLRKSDGSNTSGLFVAVITLTISLDVNPSNWESNFNIVRYTSWSPDCFPPKRLVPIASISSVNKNAQLMSLRMQIAESI